MLTPAYMVLALCLTATGGGFALGYFLHDRISIWVRSHRMSNTRPTKPRAPGRHVRNQLQEIEMDLGAADRYLEPYADKELGVARGQSMIGKALVKVARLLGMGTDDSDNGHEG
jgi:hypothetical protein